MQYFSVIFCKEEKNYEKIIKNYLYTSLSLSNCYYTSQLNIYDNQYYNYNIYYLFIILFIILLLSN